MGGNVGIGTTAPGSYNLNIAGTGYLGGASAWVYGSDRALKNNIAYMSDNTNIDALNIIGQLKPATFNYISGAQNEAGFIAQDVQTVLPNLVVQNPNGLLGLKTDDLIPYTVAAIQELNLNLEGVAGTVTPVSGSTNETFVNAFMNNIKKIIGTWLADATNGIGDVFAGNLHAKNELCINSTCVTEAQLKSLLNQAGGNNIVNNTGGGTPDTTTTQPSTPTQPPPTVGGGEGGGNESVGGNSGNTGIGTTDDGTAGVGTTDGTAGIGTTDSAQ
jgi:hypothetical protein